tara:strand:+ start:1841 stop:3787 length:1947 start_codon:yes stop_codon:yes gene_type:complete
MLTTDDLDTEALSQSAVTTEPEEQDVSERLKETKLNIRNQILGGGYEVGAGLLFDILTTPLGWAPPAYFAANFAEGAISNIIGQKIRNWEASIDWGEVKASGAIGTIPLAQLRAAKYLKKPVAEAVENVVGEVGSLKRLTLSGATLGASEPIIRRGLNKEEFSPTEVAIGAVTGGVVGAGTKPISDLYSNLVRQIGGGGLNVGQGVDIGAKGTSKPYNRGANYNPIEGADELTPEFKSQWKGKARRGDQTFYYDITKHRILDVPGMENPAQQTRYKSWLTQSLINRYNRQLLDPQHPFTHFHTDPFYDTQGQPWRLVRRKKGGKYQTGPEQPYIPMPQNEIDSRKLNMRSTSIDERKMLLALMDLNVTQRNALERQRPELVRWNSDFTGENYHEHMIALDEIEFWKSGAGKALGYNNNDVYKVEEALGNIVFLNDPRFKLFKDQLGGYITPPGKTEVYPGKTVRTKPVKKFTGGIYEGRNAVIGYDANPNSPTYTDIVVYAYNPSPDIIEAPQRVTVVPNYYSNLFARDTETGKLIVPANVRNNFIKRHMNAILSGDAEEILSIDDFMEMILKKWNINIPAPGRLKREPDFLTLGDNTKLPDPDPKGEKVFKTTPAIQRKRDKFWKRQLNLWQHGSSKQLEFKFDEEN